MDVNIVIPIALGITLILLFLKMPVGISLLFGGSIGLYLLYKNTMFIIVPQQLFNSLNSFTLVALPLFILMGVILTKGGIGERVYDIFHIFLKNISGGVGMGTVLTCALLAAMMGSSVALAATIAPFAVKNLLRLGYTDKLSTGIVAGGGALGILIPPSAIMIIYGAMTGESIGKLFMAGMFPGILATIMFCIYVAYSYVKKGKTVNVEKASTWREKREALKRGYWGLLIPAGIIVSIYTGFCTATEAASVACLLAIFATTIFHRTLSWKDFLPVLHEGIVSAASILLIITGAVVFGAFVSQSGFSAAVSNFFITHNVPLWQFLAITMLIMLIEGCFLEGVAICLIMIPILHPAIVSYNFSLITYAVLLTINVECALLTPPIGLNLFVVNDMCKAQGLPINLGKVISGSFPFLLIYLLVMILVAFFPFLSLWLPTRMIGG